MPADARQASSTSPFFVGFALTSAGGVGGAGAVGVALPLAGGVAEPPPSVVPGGATGGGPGTVIRSVASVGVSAMSWIRMPLSGSVKICWEPILASAHVGEDADPGWRSINPVSAFGEPAPCMTSGDSVRMYTPLMSGVWKSK